jgi:transcriptional regulator with XRE-family HTH domain
MAVVDPFLKDFGSNVRRFRLKSKFTQERLAEVAGLHPTYISGIERGIRNPTILSALNIANGLSCKISDLFRPSNKGARKKSLKKK